MLNSTTLENFKSHVSSNPDKTGKTGTLVPVIEEHLADMDTPVSVFSAISENKSFKNPFIFESAEGETQNGRYSFIGFNPFLLFKINGNQFEIIIKDAQFSWIKSKVKSKHPLEALNELLSAVSIIQPDNAPRLISGAVGYLGYDSIRLVENVPFDVQKDQDIPTGVLGFYNNLIIFDNVRKTLMYVYAPFISKTDSVESVFKKAKNKLNKITEISFHKSSDTFTPQKTPVNWESNLDKKTFEKNVEAAKELIRAGDIFQVVLSQRFETKFNDSPFDLYRVLRIINPSPYLYYIDFDDLKIIGSSPELLVRIDEDQVYTRPIAGTRPRGKTSDEDDAFEKELLQDKKELSEHLMLVDLGRNDLGKVCTFGSVHVLRMMKVERYSHVMHIVSDVCGILDKKNNAIEALYAAFPAGTLSGAPKIRAMEIIDELEPTERAVYGGAVGYFDFGGNMDWCIAIRTIVLNKNRLTIQAGAGIVADSIPEKEYEETMNKSQALKTAVEWSTKKNK
ncbi:MAG: anthranilate synthase component I [Calditrichaeota bacterium]|nr:MAG: anthranilate synthase component I [Calditrichota bacterium]MBL1204282.1 anthranilate synthase component I [Calditrichota bacterium]NOG44112.1 anthranilate synthase component I [Calditrichota bacterium]